MTEEARPRPQRSRRHATGASKKLKRVANASGMKISRSKKSVATISAKEISPHVLATIDETVETCMVTNISRSPASRRAFFAR